MRIREFCWIATCRSNRESSQLPYCGFDDIGRRVDFVLRTESTKAEPDRRACFFVAQPERAQYVGWIRAGRGARSAGRDGHVGRDRLEERLAMNTVDAHVQVVWQARIEGAVEMNSLEIRQ